MIRSLLDVSVLIALLDADHEFHEAAHNWWSDHRGAGWASCPLTENGVIRIMSTPSYNARRRLAPHDVTSALASLVEHSNHEFWPDEVSILDGTIFRPHEIIGPRQLTDLYLLALAVSHDGRFVTFDSSVNRAAVVGATERSIVSL